MNNDADSQLDDLRREIDKVDIRFLEDLAEFMRARMKIVQKIGEHKRVSKILIVDHKREAEIILDRKTRGRNKGLSGEMVGKIFESIVDHCRQHE